MRKKDRTPRQLKLEGAATFGLYLLDVMLVASIVAGIICGTHSTVARLFTIETFALGIIGAALVLAEQHKIAQEEDGQKSISKEGYEYFKQAIKALGREPVLDKIRAELHATAEMHEDGSYYIRDEWIDEYFDKYKVESGGE